MHMEISIDESGSFTTNATDEGAWSVVVAYVTPETEKKHYRNILQKLKAKCKAGTGEIKLYQIDETDYFSFLSELGKLKGILFSVATDSAFNNIEFIKRHQETHVQAIISGIPGMRYEEGKLGLKRLAKELSKTPPQLYVQLTCQVLLILKIIENAVNYFVQRNHNTLSSFKWRVDQKDPNFKTDFESAFEKFTPALLQTFSLESPLGLFSGFNYTKMKDFFYKPGNIPDFLIERKPELLNEPGLNIQKVFRDDIKFINSKDHDGIQIADLLASGVRRLLKSGFINNNKAALLFSNLMIQEKNSSSPILLTSFDDRKINLDLPLHTSKLINLVIKNCRPMLVREKSKIMPRKLF